jgi:hypothetical protein
MPSKTVNKSHFLNVARPVTLQAGATLPSDDTFIVIEDAEGTTVRAKGGGQGNSNNPQIKITELLEDFNGYLVKPITFLWGLTEVTRGQTGYSGAPGHPVRTLGQAFRRHLGKMGAERPRSWRGVEFSSWC